MQYLYEVLVGGQAKLCALIVFFFFNLWLTTSLMVNCLSISFSIMAYVQPRSSRTSKMKTLDTCP